MQNFIQEIQVPQAAYKRFYEGAVVSELYDKLQACLAAVYEKPARLLTTQLFDAACFLNPDTSLRNLNRPLWWTGKFVAEDAAHEYSGQTNETDFGSC